MSSIVTRRRVTLVLSILYLTALTITAARALQSTHANSLPIPLSLNAFTLALPPIAGLALETITSLNEKSTQRGQLRSSVFFVLAVGILLVWEKVLATLAGTHIAPAGGLTCGLRERWQTFFRGKLLNEIQTIQNRWNCCGFANVNDMAWPFPDATHRANACAITFGRTQGCMEVWRGEERRVAVVLLVVPIAVFAWEMVVFMTLQTRPSWLTTALRLPNNGGEADSRPPRQAIQYRDVEERDDDEDLQNEVQRLNSESEVSAQVEGARVQPSGLLKDSDPWSRESGAG